MPSFLIYVMFPTKGGNSKKLRFSSFASLRECRKRDIVPKRVWQCLFPTFRSALCAYFYSLGKSIVDRWEMGGVVDDCSDFVISIGCDTVFLLNKELVM